MTDIDYPIGAGGVPRALVIAADAAAARPACEALEAAGARVLAVLDPSAAGEGPADRWAPDLVMLEAETLDDAALDALLPAVEALSRRGAHVIAAIAPGQIDPVASHLLGRDVQLLCAPDAAQRTLAASLARPSAPTGVRESSREAERLRQLHEEVARIAETLARLAERDAAPGGGAMVGDRRPGYRARDIAPGAVVEAKDVREAIRSRRMRDQFFEPAGLFEDPAWDMLLDLFAAALEGAKVSVSSLCIAAAVAPTTALRWIGRMTEAGLFVRSPDPEDRRRAFVGLSDAALGAVRDYCTAAKRQGLPIA